MRGRSRAVVSGWTGRRRNYVCRGCGRKFEVDCTQAIPVESRQCPLCVPYSDWLVKLSIAWDGHLEYLGGNRRFIPGIAVWG